MILTLKAKWEKHSVHNGVQIWKRKAGTGTSGGGWLALNCTYSSLSRARRDIDAAEQWFRESYAEKE